MLQATGGVAPIGGAAAGGLLSTGGFQSTGGVQSTGGLQNTGGAATGGTTAGGTGTGGKMAGGTAAGGSATGGTATGGTTTGGTATGGADATGGSSGTCSGPVPGSTGTNPVFTDEYTADPAPMVSGCTFYIACGHDQGTTGFDLREWFVLKSTDMVNWTKTVGMTLSVFTWVSANAWAGQMVEKDGRFYWYVPVAQRSDGSMTIGVAVADSPEGPFADAIGGPLIDDAFEISNMGFGAPEDTPYTIDPTVFVDDDGRAYLLYGGFWRMVYAELGSDMTSISGQMRESTPRDFFEAPFLTKHDGTYYVVYAAGQNPATIDYATSASPQGPWTYGGRILDTLPNVSGQDAATSHPGVAEFAGQWYLVYHVSDGPDNGGTYRREVAVDKLFFNEDGSIQPVTPSPGLTF
jgi:beta-xylosidase